MHEIDDVNHKRSLSASKQIYAIATFIVIFCGFFYKQTLMRNCCISAVLVVFIRCFIKNAIKNTQVAEKCIHKSLSSQLI